MTTKYYLAYGSNLNIEQMRYRCPGAYPVGTAEIKDYELLFKGSGSGSYLTIEKNPGCSVPVAVWAVTEEHEASLDVYEGFPAFYYKKEMRVGLTDYIGDQEKEISAFVYIMREVTPFGIPAVRYVGTCLEGYRSFHFDEKILFDAYLKSRDKANEEK